MLRRRTAEIKFRRVFNACAWQSPGCAPSSAPRMSLGELVPVLRACDLALSAAASALLTALLVSQFVRSHRSTRPSTARTPFPALLRRNIRAACADLEARGFGRTRHSRERVRALRMRLFLRAAGALLGEALDPWTAVLSLLVTLPAAAFLGPRTLVAVPFTATWFFAMRARRAPDFGFESLRAVGLALAELRLSNVIQPSCLAVGVSASVLRASGGGKCVSARAAEWMWERPCKRDAPCEDAVVELWCEFWRRERGWGPGRKL